MATFLVVWLVWRENQNEDGGGGWKEGGISKSICMCTYTRVNHRQIFLGQKRTILSTSHCSGFRCGNPVIIDLPAWSLIDDIVIAPLSSIIISSSSKSSRVISRVNLIKVFGDMRKQQQAWVRSYVIQSSIIQYSIHYCTPFTVLHFAMTVTLSPHYFDYLPIWSK